MIHNFNFAGAPFRPSAQPPPSPMDEASALIKRYPNVSEIELARLINVYKELSALEMALMISDEDLALRMDRFSSDHRENLRIPFYQYAVLVVLGIVGIVALAWGAAIAS